MAPRFLPSRVRPGVGGSMVLLLLGALGSGSLRAGEPEAFSWTSKSGHTVTAYFLGEATDGGKKVYILRRKDDGGEVRVPADALAAESRLQAINLAGKMRQEEAREARRQTQFEKLRKFRYDKVDFATSHEEFKRRFPDAKPSPDTDSGQLVDYTLPLKHAVDFLPLGEASGASYVFFEDKLASISVLWIEADLSAEGLKPFRACLDRLVTTFGKAAGDTEETEEGEKETGLYWNLPRIGKRLEFRVSFPMEEDCEAIYSMTLVDLAIEAYWAEKTQPDRHETPE